MLIGIDDTDSPAGMCTTYLGAVLVRRLEQQQMRVTGAYLIRLNPNVPWKTRGNAAISLEVEGDMEKAFRLACTCVEELAEFEAENTHPGVVVVRETPGPAFYYKALRDFCSIREAIAVLEEAGALYRGYKNGRGLIGATAAVCSELADCTWEILVYRSPDRRGIPREVDRESLFAADTRTFPHTWDTVDRENQLVVCVPHTPDPVLFGIRGESPLWVTCARETIRSEEPVLEQVYCTNQGTDAHLVTGTIGELEEGRSYLVEGTVAEAPFTQKGGHVSMILEDQGNQLRTMAYEPTKGFRDRVRALVPGDRVIVTGSYKGGSLNIEKICVLVLSEIQERIPPICPVCQKTMTSAGTGKGYKCRVCGKRERSVAFRTPERRVRPGWYEVPSCARRHLARPLVRCVDASGGRQDDPADAASPPPLPSPNEDS
jgi:tRNA(Ile2)-agmatinylcytidine synthase